MHVVRASKIRLGLTQYSLSSKHGTKANASQERIRFFKVWFCFPMNQNLSTIKQFVTVARFDFRRNTVNVFDCNCGRKFRPAREVNSVDINLINLIEK